MGERIQAGNLIYTILEVDWLEQISGTVPKESNSKFAVVRLSVTNAGNKEMSLPMLQLVDDKGNGVMELAEIEGVEEWLGVLRNISPAETIQGRIVFEVTPKNYLLRVTDAGEPDRERFAMVNIPLRLDQKAPVSLEGPGQQQ
jgi:hypothetical protein